MRDQGELEIQFDDGPINHVHTLKAFATAWSAASAAAVIASRSWRELQALGIDGRILYANPTLMVIKREP